MMTPNGICPLAENTQLKTGLDFRKPNVIFLPFILS